MAAIEGPRQYKTASSDGLNSGSGKPSQNRLRSKGPPSSSARESDCPVPPGAVCPSRKAHGYKEPQWWRLFWVFKHDEQMDFANCSVQRGNGTPLVVAPLRLTFIHEDAQDSTKHGVPHCELQNSLGANNLRSLEETWGSRADQLKVLAKGFQPAGEFCGHLPGPPGEVWYTANRYGLLSVKTVSGGT